MCQRGGDAPCQDSRCRLRPASHSGIPSRQTRRTPQGARGARGAGGTVLEAFRVALVMPGLWRAIVLETLLGKSRLSCLTLAGLVPSTDDRARRRGPAPGMEMVIAPWVEAKETGPDRGSHAGVPQLPRRPGVAWRVLPASALISCSSGQQPSSLPQYSLLLDLAFPRKGHLCFPGAVDEHPGYLSLALAPCLRGLGSCEYTRMFGKKASAFGLI